MKHPSLKLFALIALTSLLATPAWAIRPIEDVRTSNLIENTIKEKVASDIAATGQVTPNEVRQQEVEQIREVLHLDELNQQNSMAEALRQENLDDRVRGHEDLETAMAEKNVDLHLGKVLTDMHGNRVRMEEYVLRPAANQMQFLNLTMRENRLDYVNYNAIFNATVPLNTAGIWDKQFNRTKPAVYLERESIEYSNTQDKVNYGVDYFEPTWEALQQHYVLPEKSAYLKINDIQKANFARTLPTQDILWQGIIKTETSYANKNLLAPSIKYTFTDGTYFQIQNYRIAEDGSLRQLRYDSWDNFVSDYVNLLKNFNALVFNTYKEIVMTATEFDDRNIDVVSQFLHLVDAFEGQAERPWR